MIKRTITDPCQLTRLCPLCKHPMLMVYGEGFDYDSYHCPDCKYWKSPIPPGDGSTMTMTCLDGHIEQFVFEASDFEDETVNTEPPFEQIFGEEEEIFI